MAALILIGFAYLLQMFSPLRLNTDAITLLQMGRSASSGDGFRVNGRATQFPSGFPALLSVLDRLHIACSASFIAINLLSLASSALSFYRIAQREWRIEPRVVLTAICLTLLSFAVIKHVTIPLTDLPYSALSLLALDAMTLSNHRTTGRLKMLLLSVVLVAAAISVRTIGIALLPSLAWSVLGRGNRPGYLDVLRSSTWISRLCAFIAGLMICLLLAHAEYGRALLHRMQEPLQLFKLVVFDRLNDATQLLLNSPRLGPAPILLIAVVGPVAITLVLIGMAATFRQGATELYLITFAFILILWPYADPRFEVPILPFLILLLGAGVQKLKNVAAVRIALICYQTVYVLLGFLALSYSTKLSLAGDRFADLYGSDELRTSYQSAFGRPITATSSQPLPAAVDLLRRYERRAAQAARISGR